MLDVEWETMVAAAMEERRGGRQYRRKVVLADAEYELLEPFCCLPLLAFAWLRDPRCDMWIRRDRGRGT